MQAVLFAQIYTLQVETISTIIKLNCIFFQYSLNKEIGTLFFRRDYG